VKKLTWIIQSNVSSEHDKWFDALQRTGSVYKPIKVIPFSDDLEDIEVSTPYAIAHGTTSLMKNSHKKPWNPGIFFNPENFKPSVWREKYGTHFVNYAGTMSKLKDVHFLPFAELMFLRPDGDFKDFSGSLVSKDGLKKFIDEVNIGGCMFDENLEVYLAPLSDIVHEWRTFVIDGKVVAASKYKLRTMLDKKSGAPQEVFDFAAKMVELWNPEKAYVMDICQLSNGEYKFLELNCFNASGVYLAPIDPIILAVEALFE
jgi:hypothetical protein